MVLDLGIDMQPDELKFSSFTALETLRLSYWPVAGTRRTSDFTEEQWYQFLPHQLRHIHFYFAGDFEDPEYLDEVNNFNAEWICDLGAYAKKQDTQLRSISIDYALVYNFTGNADGELEKVYEYPRDVYSRIEKGLAQLGLQFWCEPSTAVLFRWRDQCEERRARRREEGRERSREEGRERSRKRRREEEREEEREERGKRRKVNLPE